MMHGQTQLEGIYTEKGKNCCNGNIQIEKKLYIF